MRSDAPYLQLIPPTRPSKAKLARSLRVIPKQNNRNNKQTPKQAAPYYEFQKVFGGQ